MTPITFTVPGIPQTAGSKRAFVNPKTGRAIITDDNRKGKDWRACVQAKANEVYTEPTLLDGPLLLDVIFMFPRPRSHYGTGRYANSLKHNAPMHHTKRPDATKLLRALEDALTGVIWRDDAQVCEQFVRKMYAAIPGARVRIDSVGEPQTTESQLTTGAPA
jgi:crossover junction endodeoxyribonuclease RusA